MTTKQLYDVEFYDDRKPGKNKIVSKWMIAAADSAEAQERCPEPFEPHTNCFVSELDADVFGDDWPETLAAIERGDYDDPQPVQASGH